LTKIKQEVENSDNLGKMLVIDVETGEYGIDNTGVESAIKLKEKRPAARLFTIKIGFDVAVNFGS
jgi:electron transfer flavoprotein alpha/beta subunit